MTQKIQSFDVKTDTKQYPIKIGTGILSQIGQELRALNIDGIIGIVTVKKVHDLYGDTLRKSLQDAGYTTRTIFIPDGEKYKTMATIEQILDAFIRQGLDRSSIILGLGGGVIGDMSGFAASILFRGIKFIQVPTTLLSQVDASVGGKTGVNHTSGKNLIGSFYQPELVYIDSSTLKTLDKRDITGGFAEMLKIALVRDREYFHFLTKNQKELLALDDNVMNQAIEKACRLKAEVVEADERESGLRKVLNFGHTFGHAIETVAGYGVFRHGEAVLIGMYIAAFISNEYGVLLPQEWEMINESLLAPLLDVEIPDMEIDALVKAMDHDKKRIGDEIQFVLIDTIGHAFIHTQVDDEDIRMAFKTALSRFKLQEK